MALSQQVVIIICVAALSAALIISVVIIVFLCVRRRRMPEGKSGHRHRHRSHHRSRESHEKEKPKASLDHLPNAAEMKRIEGGKEFVSVAEMREEEHKKKTKPVEDPTYNFIMGPTAELSERDKQPGINNDSFLKENQIESGAYLRGGVDPADVAEAFMEDEFLKEASRPQSRRREQLDVRRKQARSNKSSSKNRNSQQRQSKTENSNNARSSSHQNGKKPSKKRHSDAENKRSSKDGHTS